MGRNNLLRLSVSFVVLVSLAQITRHLLSFNPPPGPERAEQRGVGFGYQVVLGRQTAVNETKGHILETPLAGVYVSACI